MKTQELKTGAGPRSPETTTEVAYLSPVAGHDAQEGGTDTESLPWGFKKIKAPVLSQWSQQLAVKNDMRSSETDSGQLPYFLQEQTCSCITSWGMWKQLYLLLVSQHLSLSPPPFFFFFFHISHSSALQSLKSTLRITRVRSRTRGTVGFSHRSWGDGLHTARVRCSGMACPHCLLPRRCFMTCFCR